jgi:hypothetical protein
LIEKVREKKIFFGGIFFFTCGADDCSKKGELKN